jgi:hypothetical protein
MSLTYSKRVRNGASVLDNVEGAGWRQRVDKNSLDVYSEVSCPLGQLYGSFDAGVKRILDWYKNEYPALYAAGKAAERETGEPITREERQSIFAWCTNNGFAFFQEPDDNEGAYAFPRTSTLKKRYARLTDEWRKILDENVEGGPESPVQETSARGAP